MAANHIKLGLDAERMSYYVIIRGPMASGKSTVAKSLARALKAKYISMDRMLDKHHLTKDTERGYVSQRSFRKANESSVPVAAKALERGGIVVFDGNFYWASQIRDLIGRLHCPYFVFTLAAPLRLTCARKVIMALCAIWLATASGINRTKRRLCRIITAAS